MADRVNWSIINRIKEMHGIGEKYENITHGGSSYWENSK